MMRCFNLFASFKINHLYNSNMSLFCILHFAISIILSHLCLSWTLGSFLHLNTIIKKLECLGSWHSMSNQWQFHFYTSLPSRLSCRRLYTKSIKAKALTLSLFYIQRVLIHRFDNGGKLSFQGYMIFVGMKYFAFEYSIQT